MREQRSQGDQAQKLRKMVNSSTQSKKGADAANHDNKARVITVTSGKGGVGKTNFTVNFALSLAEKGLRVLIIDADFGLSNVDVILGVSSKYDLTYVTAKGMDIKNVITEGPWGLKFISGGSGVYDLINLPKSQLVFLVNSLLQLEDFADIIIFDTGAGISDNIIHLVTSSTDVIIVSTPEPTSMMDAYALIKTINDISQQVNLKLVVNKARNEYEGAETSENFTRVVKQYLNLNIETLGIVLSDESIPKSVREQTPLLINCPKSVAAKNIRDIAMKYMGFIEEVKEDQGLKGFITRFIRGLAKP